MHPCEALYIVVPFAYKLAQRYFTMSRGRGGSEIEQERIRQGQIAETRDAGKRGSGTKNFEKKGFGSETGMQRNQKEMPADKHGI